MMANSARVYLKYFHSSFSLSLILEIKSAATMMTDSLASSDGWNLIPKMINHLEAPFSVTPLNNTHTNKIADAQSPR